MLAASLISKHVLIAYAVYFVGTASPGPSNLAIMGTAMRVGRIPALLFAAGVMSGSAFWSVMAAFGLSALLAKFAVAMVAMKIAGALYLLWLAVKSGRAAMTGSSSISIRDVTLPVSRFRMYLRGTGMHLTNPKSVLVWLSVVTLGLPQQAAPADALPVIVGCWIIGSAVFGGYAIAFSTLTARTLYGRLKRWLDAGLALVFGYAGVRLLFSSSSGA